MQVIVDDLLTNYQQTSGKNLNILFIHGWADSIAGQKSFIDDISRIGNVLALDLPGFGTSQVPDRAFSLLDYAKFVRDFCDKTGFNKIDLIILIYVMSINQNDYLQRRKLFKKGDI